MLNLFLDVWNHAWWDQQVRYVDVPSLSSLTAEQLRSPTTLFCFVGPRCSQPVRSLSLCVLRNSLSALVQQRVRKDQTAVASFSATGLFQDEPAIVQAILCRL